MGGFARFTSIRYLILQTSCFKIIVAICCFTGPQIDPTSYLWAGPEASASVDLSSLSHTPRQAAKKHRGQSWVSIS